MPTALRIDVDVDVVLLDDLRVLDAGDAAAVGPQLAPALGVEGAVVAVCARTKASALTVQHSWACFPVH